MKPPARPWVLECWEYDPPTKAMAWRKWSDTRQEQNAVAIRDRLIGRGHTARVRHLVTGAISGNVPPAPVACVHCDEHHLAPYDGTCLL